MHPRVFIRLAFALAVLPARGDDDIRFGRDILPILSAKCFACHGPDETQRKAKLRLDVESDAKAPHKHGTPVVAGKTKESTVVSRLRSTDPNEVMPPPDAPRKLTRAEADTLERWVAGGAKWGRHWSFEPVVRPTPPRLPARATSGSKSPIDAFVAAALAKKNLRLQPAAPPHVLARRLALDLVGLPPTPEEADRFAKDPSPAAYERMVDDLLARPQFGEHWARTWLDLARYADTKGYEKDLGRTLWPYRDWVVDAFNRDLPLDRFTDEQLAGDLLPGATPDQIVATAFHRNTPANDEGGTDDEEFRVVAVKDRVDTTVQVWMGLTMGCAKCHSHKYDPIPTHEYYGFYALFNQTEDADRFDDAPTMPIEDAVRKSARAKLEAAVAARDAEVHAQEKLEAASPAAKSPWNVPRVANAASANGTRLDAEPDGTIVASGPSPERDVYTVRIELLAGTHTALRLEALPVKLGDGKTGVGRSPADPNFVLSEITATIAGSPGPLKWGRAQADFAQDQWPVANAIDGKSETGWAISPKKSDRHVAVFAFAEPLVLVAPATLEVALSQQYGAALTLARFRLSTSAADAATLNPLDESPAIAAARRTADEARAALRKFDDATPRIPVFRELAADKRRETRLHRRGNFLDPGEPVAATVLTAFGALPAGAPTNRLGVARWLVNHDNPLTPRVWANRVWARLNGLGIVETEEDFGALGALPANPELLDWLAAEYRDDGWSLKRLLKTIVLSAAYRQSSDTDPARREADPVNALSSRGARFRLSAEVVRDESLAVAGLLSSKRGGPPVMPPQPSGLWRSTYNGQQWIDAEGEDRWRRGLYTYWKRTTPYPSMLAFDAGSREVCQIRRIPSNTPLQALVTLNDPVYLEAAAALAGRMIGDASGDQGRMERGLRLALVRPVRAGEATPLLRLRAEAEREFAADPKRADDFLASGRARVPDDVPRPAFAAWMVAANAILNLDEFLTRH